MYVQRRFRDSLPATSRTSDIWKNKLFHIDSLEKRRLNPLAAAFIYLATSTECAGPIKRPTAVKGLRPTLPLHTKLSSDWLT